MVCLSSRIWARLSLCAELPRGSSQRASRVPLPQREETGGKQRIRHGLPPDDVHARDRMPGSLHVERAPVLGNCCVTVTLVKRSRVRTAPSTAQTPSSSGAAGEQGR